jgi:hypothetical protein
VAPSLGFTPGATLGFTPAATALGNAPIATTAAAVGLGPMGYRWRCYRWRRSS